jgi:hypothetical protein
VIELLHAVGKTARNVLAAIHLASTAIWFN